MLSTSSTRPCGEPLALALRAMKEPLVRLKLEDLGEGDAFDSIVHLHGALGTHPSQCDDPQTNREYSSDTDIRIAAEGIRIVHEVEPSDVQFQLAHRLLAEAQRVCFLGFGYSPTNLGRLKLPSRPGLSYYGSMYGMGQADIDAARSRIPGAWDRKAQLGPPKHDCYGFLREVFGLR